MNWNVIKQIKMFLDDHPDAPFDIEITNWLFKQHCFDNQKWDVKVIMKKYLQPEEDDLEVDGIGLEHKKLSLFSISKKNHFNIYIMDQMTKQIKVFVIKYPNAHIEITSKEMLLFSRGQHK